MTPALCPIVVFAKAPRAGFAKTRLIPALGAEGAARLAARLLDATVRHACAAALGSVEVCCTPDEHDAAFTRVAREHGVTLTSQGDGDLGQRMERALTRVLSEHRRVLLVGSDILGLDRDYLHAAAQALDDRDAVVGLAHDGGFTLIGLTSPAPGLFDGIAWSTPHVMRQTRERLAAHGIQHHELPALHDVDEPADLAHVPPDWLR